jgi:Tfp pilus assembly protein PilF
VVRVLLVALALTAGGWLALGLRSSERLADADTVLAQAGGIDPAAAARARRLLDGATVLQPRAEAELLRARADAAAGDRAAALARLERLVADEPESIDAWTALAFLAGPGTSAFARAERAIARLSPPVPVP